MLGEFPEGLDDVLVTLRSATEAAGRSLAPSGQVVLGCDVARFGHDKTVVVRRQGPFARIVWRASGADTMETAEFLRGYCASNVVDAVVVDDLGVGGGVVDRLRELGLGRARVVTVHRKRAGAGQRAVLQPRGGGVVEDGRGVQGAVSWIRRTTGR